MVDLKKYNLSGQEVGRVQIADGLAEAEVQAQSLKDYIVAIRNNARQWSACTKGRSEVNHSGQKPHRQKGTGRARQGCLAAPQYKGGGVVFGPRPKFDQHVRINRKERRQVIRALLGDKIRNDRLVILEDPSFEEPKTKRVSAFLKGAALQGRILFVGEASYMDIQTEGKKERISVPSLNLKAFSRSICNLPKAQFTLLPNLSGYDVALAHTIVMTESAFKELQEREESR
ncbi:MAG: 50S ribosomal protein L4 [Verrucomicrobia bacterium]|nr:50S ribosomal protein L4 [Verrucomicrobiota bacterium]